MNKPSTLSRLALALSRGLLVLWVGALWAVGYLAAPVLFASLPRLVAGEVAGKLFFIVGWIGMVAGILLLAYVHRTQAAGRERRLRLLLLSVLWLLAAAQLFWLQPVIAAIKAQLPSLPPDVTSLGPEFAFWHALSSALYLLQSLAGLILVMLGGVESRRPAVA